MAKKSYPSWIRYGTLIMGLSICTTSFAFTQVCINMIPGVWFVAKMRLKITGGDLNTYTTWSNSVTLGFHACFPTNIYVPQLAGFKIIPQVSAVSGKTINCLPNPVLVKDPSPGTYAYNVWGTVSRPDCSGDKIS